MMPLGRSGGYMRIGVPMGHGDHCDSRILGYAALASAGARALLAFGVAMLVTSLAKGGEEQRPEDVVEMVIRAIAHNYQQIKSAEATIQGILEDRTVKAPERREFKLEGGGRGVELRAPRQETRVVVFLRGENIRYEQYAHPVQGDGQPLETIAIRDGVARRLDPRGKRGTIGDLDAVVGGKPLFDPREVGQFKPTATLADDLRGWKVLSAELTDAGDGSSVARIVAEGPYHQRFTYHFRSEDAFLPGLIELPREDGSVVMGTTITYQDVLDGKAKFLKEMMIKSFDKGVAASGREDTWLRALRYTVTELRVNRDFDDTVFDVEFPAGTIVLDSLAEKGYVVGEDDKRVRGTGGVRWFLAIVTAGIVLALVVVVVYVYRRRG